VGIGWESAGPNMTAMLQSRDERERLEREERTAGGRYVWKTTAPEERI
jgi:hypothetical protein